MYKLYSYLVILLILTGCAIPVSIPKNINNACDIIQEHPGWYYDMQAVYQKWHVPLSVQLAIIRQESGFNAHASPPTKYILGFIPIGKISSAYGYAQALDGTWVDYQLKTSNRDAQRSNFSDAIDFIGWYASEAYRVNQIDPSDTYNLYLSYHEGIYSYKKNSKYIARNIKNYALKTQNWGYTYAKQLRNCAIPRKPWLRFFY